MQQTSTELVIRVYGVTIEQRDQLCDRLLREGQRHGVHVEAEVGGGVLGDLNVETILAICTVVQTGVSLVQTIHSILEPWLAEQRAARAGSVAREPVIKAEIVIDGRVVSPAPEEPADTTTA